MTESPLMSEADVLEYLGVDKRLLVRIMVERRLSRHPVYRRLFAREHVEQIAQEIRKEIDEAQMGPQERQVGGEPRLRQVAEVVP